MSAMSFEGDVNRGPIIDTSAGSSAAPPADTRPIQFVVESFTITVLASEYDAGEPQIVLPERLVLRCLGEKAMTSDTSGKKKEVTICSGARIEVDLAREHVIRPGEGIPDQRTGAGAEAEAGGHATDSVAIAVAPLAFLIDKANRQFEQHLFDHH
jgi:hypothetical protein